MENPKYWTKAHWAIDLAIAKYHRDEAQERFGKSLTTYVFDELKAKGFVIDLPAENTFVSPFKDEDPTNDECEDV